MFHTRWSEEVHAFLDRIPFKDYPLSLKDCEEAILGLFVLRLMEAFVELSEHSHGSCFLIKPQQLSPSSIRSIDVHRRVRSVHQEKSGRQANFMRMFKSWWAEKKAEEMHEQEFTKLLLQYLFENRVRISLNSQFQCAVQETAKTQPDHEKGL